MRNIVTKLAFGLFVGLFAVQMGVGSALAGKPDRSTDPTTYPKGIQDKLQKNSDGTRSTTTGRDLKGHWGDQLQAYNDSITDCCSDPSDPTENAAVVFCPTSLPEAQLLACLGQSSVKAPRRVKKLDVQLGQ